MAKRLRFRRSDSTCASSCRDNDDCSRLKAADDTLLAESGASWKVALDIYAALQRQVSKHPG